MGGSSEGVLLNRDAAAAVQFMMIDKDKSTLVEGQYEKGV